MTDPTRSVRFDGRTEYRDADGRLHRDDGPAVTELGGYKAWFVDGLRHRVDGPAVVFPDGAQVWYCRDKLHRLDGPAYIDVAKGQAQWWFNGERREDLEELIAAPVLSTRVELNDGTVEYRDQFGSLHRVDGPARIFQDGTQVWCLNGRLHRTDGPAHTSPDGHTEWWINGQRRHDIEQAVADAQKANKDD